MIFKIRLFIPEVKFRCENNGNINCRVNTMVHKLGALKLSRTNHRVWQLNAQNKCIIGCVNGKSDFTLLFF